MPVQVNLDGANNVYIGGSISSKSTAQDMIDSMQTFVDTMINASNWSAGARTTNATATNLANYQFEFRPHPGYFFNETLTGSLSNFVAGNTITNGGARFRVTPFQARSWVRTSSIVNFTTGTNPTLVNGPGYRIVGNNSSVVGVYYTGIGQDYIINWTGILDQGRYPSVTYGSNFASFSLRFNSSTSTRTLTASKTLRIGASTLIPLIKNSYPIVCSNGTNPNNTLWASDLFLQENNIDFNYMTAGKTSNILIGKGNSFVEGEQYRLPFSDQNNASNLFLCAGRTDQSEFLLIRIFEQTP